MSLDLGPAIRAAILAPEQAALWGQLSEWRGEPAVFSFRPVPEDAGDRIVIINPDASITDQDGLTSPRPVVTRDVIVYGRKGTPGDPADDSPIVEAIGYQLRELFHRQKFSVRPTGYSVIGIVARGPFVAPVDDDGEIARMVNLTIRLRKD